MAVLVKLFSPGSRPHMTKIGGIGGEGIPYINKIIKPYTTGY
jgi:hypothetical protein